MGAALERPVWRLDDYLAWENAQQTAPAPGADALHLAVLDLDLPLVEGFDGVDPAPDDAVDSAA